jgi:hypothetical protein
MTSSSPTSTARGGLGLVVLFVAAGPVVGALTLLAALALGGQSFESQDPASPARFVALLVPVAWGVAAYALGRRRDMSPAAAAGGASLAAVWAVASVLLVAVLL